jgi:hypothetical protein
MRTADFSLLSISSSFLFIFFSKGYRYRKLPFCGPFSKKSIKNLSSGKTPQKKRRLPNACKLLRREDIT